MRELSIELQSKVPQRLKDEPDVANWKNIENRLNQAEGLEAALHNERPRPVVEESIREVTASFIRNADRNALNRVLLGETSFRLSAYLNRFNIRNDGLIIITTNYDRLIEYSCEMSNIRVDTLFVGKFISSFSPNESKYAFCKGISKFKSKPKVEYAPKVTVLKPHGCLSWYYVDGQAKAIPHLEQDNCLIITPGVNKYREGYNEPFDTHRTKANMAIDSALRYIIIGYGFGDDHLETHLMRQLNSNKPALIITHTLSDKAMGVVKKCKNVIALCCKDNGTIVITKTDEIFLPDINLWDIREMIKEVF